eukprot:SAG31_NODE_21683_length_543_cov_1.139640_1_plen_130_part_10
MRADDLDALVIPGGFAPDYMRRCEHMKEIVRAMHEDQGKPVGAICHGPWMLCSARRKRDGQPLISGVRATAFNSIKDDMTNAGCIWEDAPAVIDQNIITSRTPADLGPFCEAFFEMLGSEEPMPKRARGS